MARHNVAPTIIVEPNEMINVDYMLQEKIVLTKLNFEKKIDILRWLANDRLIKNCRICQDCEYIMSFIIKTRSIDGYVWSSKNCKKPKAFVKNNFFQEISVNKILNMKPR
jgi:hypothetical protein